MLTWPTFEGHGVAAVVTTRAGGVSEGPYATLNLGLHVGDDPQRVVENRRRAAAAIGLGLDDLVFCRQAHGRDVAVVGAGERGRGTRSDADAIAGVDALITRDPGVGLVVMVADCVPLVLFDPVTRTLATVHAGWRGTVARVVTAALEAMGGDPADVLAALGPAVPPERYQVGADVAEAARACFGDRTDAVLAPDATGAWRFDLWTANRLLLEDSGVRQIAEDRSPTGPGTPYFSDRAERPCGRFAVLARLLR